MSHANRSQAPSIQVCRSLQDDPLPKKGLDTLEAYLEAEYVRIWFFDFIQDPDWPVKEVQVAMSNILEKEVMRVAVSQNVVGHHLDSEGIPFGPF